MSPAELRRRNVYRLDDTTPTGQVLRESVAGEEVLEQALGGEPLRAHPRADRARGGGAARLRRRSRRARCAPATGATASGIGLALAWHGAGFTGSGEVYLASVASVELTADGRIRVLTAHDRDGPGHEDGLPADGRDRARRAGRLGRVRAAGHRRGARFRARPSRAAP